MTRTAVIAVVIFVALIVAARLSYGRAVTLASNPKAQEAIWKGRIEAVGGARAYKEFASAVRTLSPQEQHQAAHVFGGALFDALSVRGLAVCDARFNYGCYHEFLGRAIASLGLSVVNTLNQGCVDALEQNALSCQHGIGHGVEASLGYTDTALKKSLAVCRDLPYNDPIGGCYGGVFMEYNMQTMLGDEARTRTATADLLAPCDSLRQDYRLACAFWQPQWWLQLQHEGHVQGDSTVDFGAVGVLCDAFKDANIVRGCYEGLGTMVAAESRFVPAVAARMCDEASTSSIHALYCKSYAANSLTLGGAGKIADGRIVCDGLPKSDHEYCMAYAQNHANLVQEITTP